MTPKLIFKLSVRSAPAEGSTFTLCLPLGERPGAPSDYRIDVAGVTSASGADRAETRRKPLPAADSGRPRA